MRALRTAPPAIRLLLGALIVFGLWAAANAAYQVLRKPTELFFPVSGALAKTPQETWREYGPQFRKYATARIPPELLAALAQVEGAGNPVARTYWRWRPTWHPFELYRPASSAVGMYQITDGTFAQGKPECLDEPAISADQAARDRASCWLESVYARVVPSEAVKLTSALLDRSVTTILKRRQIASATPRQQQDLATVIHLCGAGAGEAYALRHFRLIPGQRCGGQDEDAGAYLARVNAMKLLFARLENAE